MKPIGSKRKVEKLPPRSSAWEYWVKLPQNSSKSELLKQINELEDINNKLRNRIMELSRDSPTFEPESDNSESLSTFEPEPKSNLR